jgi:hypothetical protein
MKSLKHLLIDMIPEKLLVLRHYKKEFGYYPNLRKPHTFTEKIQWLKLYDQKPLKVICADKLLVRKYVEEKSDIQYLIPIVFHTAKVDEITCENMPDFPVILKPNHDSGGGIVILDKNLTDFKKVQETLKQRLSNNYYYDGGEWEYKYIKPCVIVEHLIYDKQSKNTLLNDYKIHCFNGRPMYIQTIFDRKTDLSETWYDTNWNMLELSYFSKTKKDIPKPAQLSKMLEVAAELSEDFKYVRIDLYEFDNKVLFGEMTFHPFCGMMKWDPPVWDRTLGDELRI